MNKILIIGFSVTITLAFIGGIIAYVWENHSEERMCLKSHQEDLASKAPISVIHNYITVCDEWGEVKQK